jgi:AcrR family transcriptional regulator
MRTNSGITRHEDVREGSAAAQIEGLKDRYASAIRTAARGCSALPAQFAMTGLHGTTTLALARATGISEGILYAHFGSKKGLFRAAVEDNIRTRLQLLEACPLSAAYESEIAAIRRSAEATVTLCASGRGIRF